MTIQKRSFSTNPFWAGMALACFSAVSLVQADRIPAEAKSDSGKPPHDDYSLLSDGSCDPASFVQFERGGNSSVVLDMGSTQPVDRLVVVGRPVAGVPNVSRCRVEVSENETDWTEVADVDNTGAVSILAGTPRNSGGTLAIGFAPRSARYVRLHLTDAAKSEQIAELMLFSKSGPRVSLVDRGEKFNMTTDGLTDKYPYYLVDGISDDSSKFVLYSGSAKGPVRGDFTLRLESPEYAAGWDQILLSGRGTSPEPSNPPTVTIAVANAIDGPFTVVHTESFEGSTTPWQQVLKMPSPRTEKYVKVSWASNEKSFTPLNIQFTEVDVAPVSTKP